MVEDLGLKRPPGLHDDQPTTYDAMAARWGEGFGYMQDSTAVACNPSPSGMDAKVSPQLTLHQA